MFALGGLAAFVWLARREILDDLAGRAPVGAAATRPAPVGTAPVPQKEPVAPKAAAPPSERRRRGRDELAEDALLDAQPPGPHA